MPRRRRSPSCSPPREPEPVQPRSKRRKIQIPEIRVEIPSPPPPNAVSSEKKESVASPEPEPESTAMKKIVIAGTGGLAQHIARAAIDEGYEVTLLSRSERPDLLPLKVVKVDYTIPFHLHKALSGVDTLISTVHHHEPQLALIDACLTARVSRFAPAEFEGALDSRPIAGVKDSEAPSTPLRDGLAVLGRLREERHRLDSTVFVCGLLYERFAPGGLKGSGVCSSEGRMKGEGEYLLNYREANIPAFPMNDSKDDGDEVTACFTAAKDVGKFVASALGLETWPEQLRCHGERLKLDEVVKIAEEVKGVKFSATKVTWEELHGQMLEAEDSEQWDKASQIDALLATQLGEFDFQDPILNQLFPDIKPVPLKEWLEDAWKNTGKDDDQEQVQDEQDSVEQDSYEQDLAEQDSVDI